MKPSNSNMSKPPKQDSVGMPGRLKIGFVFDDSLDRPDGVQQYILAIGNWLSMQGHEVHYLVGETARQDPPHVHSLSRNMHVTFNGNRLSVPLPASKRTIRKLLAAESFDLLHVQVPYSPMLAGRIIRAAPPSTAVVGTFHIAPYSWLVSAATRLLGIWSRPTIKRFDEMVSVSSAAQQLARRAYGIESDIVPNAFDYPRFHTAKPLSQYDDSKLTILFLGRLVARKGCGQLLRAVALLQARGQLPDCRVVICGKGPELANLQRFVANNALQPLVEFVGFVSEADKPAYFASADIAVFPSSGGESFGIVLIEAMASGRAAVLAGDNSGYRSVLETQPDLLFDPRSDSQLAETLLDLMQDSTRRRNLASWGADYAQQFDQAVVGQQILTSYAKALHKRR